MWEGEPSLYTWTPVCLKPLTELSDSNQTSYIPASQKGPLLVLLLADLPKMLGTHLFSFHTPFWDNKLRSSLATLEKGSFCLLSVHV